MLNTPITVMHVLVFILLCLLFVKTYKGKGKTHVENGAPALNPAWSNSPTWQAKI